MEVKFDSFVVRLGSRALVKGRGVVAHVEGRNGERPDADVFAGVDVEWSADGPGLHLLPPLSYAAGAGGGGEGEGWPVFGYSVVVVGVIAGNHSLRAQVTVGASAVFPHASRVNYTVAVEVVEPLSLCGPASLVLPFAGRARLPPLSHGVRVVALPHPQNTTSAPQPPPPSSTPLPALVSLTADATQVTARGRVGVDDAGDDGRPRRLLRGGG